MKRNIQNIKQDYVYLRDNPEVVFLNSSATSLKPDVFVNKLTEVYLTDETSFGKTNVDNIINKDEKYSATLGKVAKHMNSPIEDILPTYGTTDFINKVARSLLNELNDGDEVILGKMEHAANILPWTMIAKELNKDIVFKWYTLKDWEVDYDQLKDLITDKTKVMAVAHVFNTTGAKNDLSKIRESIGDDVILVVDGAQAIGHIKIDITQGNVDYYIFGAHKAFGPHALGFAYIKGLYDKQPWTYGGGSNITYTMDDVTWKGDKSKFLSGTRDVPGVVAFGASMDYIEDFGIEAIEAYNNDLKAYAEEKIGSIEKVRIINKGVKSSNLFFEVKGVAGEDIGYHLGLKKIIVRTGTNCVKITYGEYEAHQAVRASFHIYNTKADIDRLYLELMNGGDFLDTLFNKRPASKACK